MIILRVYIVIVDNVSLVYLLVVGKKKPCLSLQLKDVAYETQTELVLSV